MYVSGFYVIFTVVATANIVSWKLSKISLKTVFCLMLKNMFFKKKKIKFMIMMNFVKQDFILLLQIYSIYSLLYLFISCCLCSAY